MSLLGCLPWYIPVKLWDNLGTNATSPPPLCDGHFTMKFHSVMLEDDNSSCKCMTDCEGLTFEAYMDSGVVDVDVECGGDDGFRIDPYAMVQQVTWR